MILISQRCTPPLTGTALGGTAPLTGGGTCDDVLVNKVKEMLRAEAELKDLEQRVVEKKQLIETLKAEIMPDPIPPRK